MDTLRFGQETSAFQARYDAQKIAFGPVVFQCARLAWKHGVLAKLEDGKASTHELAQACGLSDYAVRLLLESCLSAGLVSLADDQWVLEKIGYMLVRDELTQVNFDFVNDVCWQGLFDLEAALQQERPVGLRHLGAWPTIYEGLSALPEPARSSWFAFDHFYSDSAFPEALEIVCQQRPQRLMDVGANTGKWALQCLARDAELEMTLVDLPIQLDQAQHNLAQAGHLARCTLAPRDLLAPDLRLPAGCDAIWMSQFLSCFGLADVQRIIAAAAAALPAGGTLYLLDTFWDRQQHEIAAYSLINTSPYFTAMASGNSMIYRARDYLDAGTSAGLVLDGEWDGLGLAHSLLRLRKPA